MKLKTLSGVILAGCLLSSLAFGKTTQLTGTICSFDTTQITMQVGNDSWTIQRKTTTTVSGKVAVGATVTVTCDETDAHKNEAPCTPTPTPPSG